MERRRRMTKYSFLCDFNGVKNIKKQHETFGYTVYTRMAYKKLGI